MDLRQLQANWDLFGRTDPMWAILTVEDKRGGKWDEAEFFATGREEIRGLMNHAARLGAPAGRRAALDFGCGMGRLSQGLCEHFDRVTGVDIAPSMVAEARRCNRYGDRCEYHVNDRDDLSAFPDRAFDLIYSNMVLQHMRPEYSRRYIREFVRLLAPGGVTVFQIPTEGPAPVGETGKSYPPALPASACRAEITPDPAALTLAPGEPFTVRARVANRGGATWSAGRPGDRQLIRLGGLWKDEAGGVVPSGARAALPADVPPGGEVVLPLAGVAPPGPGRYVLELDMVQEYVHWFAAHGSPAARVSVTVRPPDGSGRPGDAAPAAPPPPTAVMEMYGVPWAEVIREVAAAGGAVLDVHPDGGLGDGWYSYTYTATRRA